MYLVVYRILAPPLNAGISAPYEALDGDSVGHKLFYSDHDIDTLIGVNYRNDIFVTYTSVRFEESLAAGAVKTEQVILADKNDDTVQDTFWPIAINGYLVSWSYISRIKMYSLSPYDGADLLLLRCAPWWCDASGNYQSGVKYGVMNLTNAAIEANTIGVCYYVTWIRGEVGIFSSAS